MPKVSVIIPVYNVEKYLRECLDSVVNQTLTDIEIICVDDGSTDSSGKILDEYATKDNRIKVIHKENGGYGKAMNVGLDNAIGEYIGIVEPDDYVELNMYETLYNKAIENDVDFVKGDLYYWWSIDNTRKYITCIGDNALYGIVQNDFSNPRLSVSTVANWAGIYRRNFINKYNIRHLETPGASYQDQGFYYKVIFNAKSAYFVNHAFYHYRQDNMSSSINNKDKIYCIFDEYEEIEKYLANIENKEKFYQVVFLKKYNSCCWNYGRINSNLKPLFYSKLCSEFANGYYEGKISRCNFNRQQWIQIQTWVKDFEKNNKRPKPLNFNKIPIALASDKNYAPQMYVTLVSILENKNYNTFYDFYLLVPKNFPYLIKKKFKELQNKYYHNKITFLDMNNEFKNQKMHISHITIPTFYRLKLPNLLSSYSKVLYLDVDTCVCADLFELYNIDLKSNYIAGVPAAGYYFNEEVHCKRLNIPSMKKYVNAGVLLMNLNKMREDSLTNKFIDLTKNDYSSQDQDIINVACYGHIKIIPLKYNFMTKYKDNFIKCEKDISYNIEIYDRNEIIEALDHPIIIHYADKIKPWDDKSAYKASFWWEYAKQCPYNFEKNSSLWRYIFSVCNNSTKTHKIITICGVKVKIKRKVFQNIFSAQNKHIHKVITILGIKFKFKSKKLVERMRFNEQEARICEIQRNVNNLKNEFKKQITEKETAINNLLTNSNELKVQLQKQNNELLEKIHTHADELKVQLQKQQDEFNRKNQETRKLQYEIKKQIMDVIKRSTPQPTLRSIAYHVVDHCNLKCCGCDHFSPLAQERFESVESFENDIKRFAELSNAELQIFKLMGGEPLLHPQLKDFMRIARQYLPNTRIEVVTNAILLNSQNEDFWKTCNQYNIVIVPTKYPLKTDYNKAEETAKSYNVKLEYYGNTNEVLKTSYHIPLDTEGTQNAVENFLNCFHANNCVFLKNGKLYTCTVAPNIEHFNKYFNKNIPLTERDGFDIHKAKNIDEILEFLAKPIPFCKYCNVKGRTFGHEWGTSKKEIEEWI